MICGRNSRHRYFEDEGTLHLTWFANMTWTTIPLKLIGFSRYTSSHYNIRQTGWWISLIHMEIATHYSRSSSSSKLPFETMLTSIFWISFSIVSLILWLALLPIPPFSNAVLFSILSLVPVIFSSWTCSLRLALFYPSQPVTQAIFFLFPICKPNCPLFIVNASIPWSTINECYSLCNSA